MQIGALEIYDAFSNLVLDVGVADVPFLRNSPIEHLSAAWDFMQHQRNRVLKKVQTLPNTVAGNASTDWIKRLNQRITFVSLGTGINGMDLVAQMSRRRCGLVG